MVEINSKINIMIFYLTNILLDITFGVLWWTTKNTTHCIYNGVLFIRNYNSNQNEMQLQLNDYSNLIIMTEKDYNILKKIELE